MLGPKYVHGFYVSLAAGYERRFRKPSQRGLLRFARLISSILNRRKGLIGSHALLPRYSMCQWRPSPSSTKGDNGSNPAKVPPVERILVTHRSVPTWFLSGNRSLWWIRLATTALLIIL